MSFQLEPGQIRHEGVGALFHGLSANYIKVAPSIAIAFVTYEVRRCRLTRD